MTRYAYDPARRTLLASWPTGDGDVATTVAVLASSIDDADCRRLALALTYLTEAIWNSYTASAPLVALRPGGEIREHPKQTQPAEIITSIRSPQLPDKHGNLLVSYEPLVAAAEQLGRVLHDIDHPGLTDAMVADVESELDALDAAGRGDLRGRAAQATSLSRRDTSPVYIAIAHEIMRKHPFRASDLHTMVDPASAAVVAAHWFMEAITLTAESTGVSPYDVLDYADDIQAFPTMATSLVADVALDGYDLAGIIGSLIFDALLVAQGYPPGDEVFAEITTEAHRRLTPLDPQRPAPDLLEDLLSCMTAAFIVWDVERDTDDDEDEETDSGKALEEYTTLLSDRAHAGRWKIGLAEPPAGTDREAGAYWQQSV